jgi:hypothetical protein
MKCLNLLLIPLIAVVAMSCGIDGTVLMKPVTGKPGETVIVIAEGHWKGTPGDTIFKYLTQPQLGLPQEEPILDIVNIPPRAFKAIFKTARNIILTKISTTVKEPSIKIQKDIWAAPQVVLSIQAPDENSFATFFRDKSDIIIAAFAKAERERLMSTYGDRRFLNKAVYNTMKDSNNFFFNMPKGYTFAKEEEDFAWIRYETPMISQGIFAYWYPYKSDSTFTLKYLLNKRDSLLKKYVPGSVPGSWMTTERRYVPTFQAFKLNGNYSVEIRGLWKAEGDFMGGPFVSLTTLDPIRQRIVTLEGYVYAPMYDKREYLRQLEAMIYSIKFPDQKKNDKINRMYELGEPIEAESKK